jgi:hypothetical protein
MKEADIPHRTDVTKKTLEAASGVEQRIKERYRVRCCLIAWLWTCCLIFSLALSLQW